MNETLRKDIFVFLILLFICTISVLIWFPQIDIDFYNYQLYNGWAFLTNRLNTDFMAAGFRSYWNPYLDAFQYLMATNLNNHRFIYAILMNLDTVLGLFLTYKIADKVLLDNIKNRNLSVSLILLYVTFSPVMYRILDSSKNDMFLADLILLAFYFLLKAFANDNKKTLLFISLAGGITGLAIGLKLTAAVYGLSLLLCLTCLYKNWDKPVKVLLLFLLSMICTFLIIDGYWLYTIYSKFQNPVFPIFNNVFHSHFSDFTNIYDGDFNQIRPQNVFQLIFYPFLWSKDFCFGSHKQYFDIRYAINFICTFIILIGYKKNFSFPVKQNIYSLLLVLFCIFSYEINVFLFGVYRYIVASSLLFGLILFLTLSFLISNFKIFKNYKINVLMIIIFLIAMFTQKINDIEYLNIFKNNKPILNKVQNYDIRDDAYVLTGGFGTPGNLINQNKNAKYTLFVYPKFIYYNYLKQYENVLGFYSMFYFSDYQENNLKKILQSDKDVYIYFRTRDLQPFYGNTVYSIEYYSDGKRSIANCQNIYSEKSMEKYLEGYQEVEIPFFDYVLCELKRK